MKPEKVITHGGIFHADEVFAIALIHEVYGNDIPVERTRTISAEDFGNPNVWIVDVGGQFDTTLNNLDHHHDAELDAACMLVLAQLFARGVITSNHFEELKTAFKAISHIDRNGHAESNGFQVNSLINSFNALPNGWEIALNTAQCYIKAAFDSVKKGEESLRIWDAGQRIGDHGIYCYEFPIHWKRYNEKRFLVYPKDGKYNVLSIDSEKHPLVSTGKEEFLHKGKFIAVFASANDAIECALLSEAPKLTGAN